VLRLDLSAFGLEGVDPHEQFQLGDEFLGRFKVPRFSSLSPLV